MLQSPNVTETIQQTLELKIDYCYEPSMTIIANVRPDGRRVVNTTLVVNTTKVERLV